MKIPIYSIIIAGMLGIALAACSSTSTVAPKSQLSTIQAVLDSKAYTPQVKSTIVNWFIVNNLKSISDTPYQDDLQFVVDFGYSDPLQVGQTLAKLDSAVKTIKSNYSYSVVSSGSSNPRIVAILDGI